jgi:uncharacterized integral membrane protein
MEPEPERGNGDRGLYALIAGVALAVIYLVAFVVSNSQSVKVSFVVADGHLSLIWVMLASLLIGVAAGVAGVGFLRRRRSGTDQTSAASRETPSSMSSDRQAE